MGIYSHYTQPELKALREKLIAQLHSPASASTGGRSVAHRSPDHLRREINDINDELARRDGVASRRPIYVI